MGRALRHREIEELLGAFALDAVEPDEAELISAHLVDCPRCRAEVAEHREAATLLAHVGADAPEGVWAKIAGSLEETPPALDMGKIVPMGTARRSAPVRWMAAITAVAAAIAIALGVQVVRQEHRMDRLAAAVSSRGVSEAAAAAPLEPGARTVDLRSSDGSLAARAVITRDGRGYLLQGSLPSLDSAETYQLWGLVADRTVSLGVLGPDPRVAQFQVVGDVKALAVTNEERGGVVQSKNKPVVQGFLPTA